MAQRWWAKAGDQWKVAERVGFEPTLGRNAYNRFRIGAVVTASVPLREGREILKESPPARKGFVKNELALKTNDDAHPLIMMGAPRPVSRRSKSWQMPAIFRHSATPMGASALDPGRE
jgi:hypothetical protein